MTGSHQSVCIGGANVACLTMADAVSEIISMARDLERTDLVVTPNTHHLTLLETDPRFRQLYRRASLVVADGWPIAALATVIARRWVPRVSGADLMPTLMAAAHHDALSVAILGGPPGAAQLVAKRMSVSFPNAKVVLAHPLPEGIDEDPIELAKLRDALRIARPHLLFLGIGAPKQEFFFQGHLADLPIGVVICVGAAIGFQAGLQRRAPALVQSWGLEWLFRLVLEPRRLAPRYLRAARTLVVVAIRCASLRKK